MNKSRKEYMRKYQQRPEVKERRKQYRERPEVKERRKEYRARPEVKEIRKEYRARPENREKAKQNYSRPKDKEIRKQYRERPENRERMKQYRARPENRERMKQYKARPENREKRKQYIKNRKKIDLDFKIKTSLRSRMSKTIINYINKGLLPDKVDKQIDYKAVCIHLKNTLPKDYGQPGVTYHIDHIRPLVSFNFEIEEDIKQANHYTNLQWLLAEDNLRKSGTWEAVVNE